jgi:hypothetical protein
VKEETQRGDRRAAPAPSSRYKNGRAAEGGPAEAATGCQPPASLPPPVPLQLSSTRKSRRWSVISLSLHTRRRLLLLFPRRGNRKKQPRAFACFGEPEVSRSELTGQDFASLTGVFLRKL